MEQIRRASFYCIISSLLFFSCQKKDDVEIPRPIKELLQKNQSCTCEPFIDQYLWKSQTIYLFSCKGPTCDCSTLYYDQQGDKFEMPAGYMPDTFREESKFIRNIWTCN